jgi:hypothetical protein
MSHRVLHREMVLRNSTLHREKFYRAREREDDNNNKEVVNIISRNVGQTTRDEMTHLATQWPAVTT